MGQLTGYVRARGAPDTAVDAIRQAVGRLDPSLPVYGVRTLEDEIAGLLLAIACLASVVPARRALGLDVIEVLRSE